MNHPFHSPAASVPPLSTAGAANHQRAADAATSFSPVGVAATLPMVACQECEGSGEVYFIALDSVRYEIGECPDCDGTGLVEAACSTCEGQLWSDGFCPSCADFDTLIARDLNSAVQL